MELTPAVRPLTPDLIHQLLARDARAEMPADYVRLMEIYCVVKAGGRVAQIEAARRLEETEKAGLRQEIAELSQQPEAEGRVRALQHEIQELERSIANRISYLAAIAPQEEAMVRQCLPDIDAYFERLG
jgi:hypothetical protein